MEITKIAKIENELQKIIKNLLGIDAGLTDSLIESRLIDSVSVIDLSLEMEEAFGIKITAVEVKPENFESIALMAKFVCSKK